MALEQTHTLKVQQPDDCLARITEQGPGAGIGVRGVRGRGPPQSSHYLRQR